MCYSSSGLWYDNKKGVKLVGKEQVRERAEGRGWREGYAVKEESN